MTCAAEVLLEQIRIWVQVTITITMIAFQKLYQCCRMSLHHDLRICIMIVMLIFFVCAGRLQPRFDHSGCYPRATMWLHCRECDCKSASTANLRFYYFRGYFWLFQGDAGLDPPRTKASSARWASWMAQARARCITTRSCTCVAHLQTNSHISGAVCKQQFAASGHECSMLSHIFSKSYST